MEKSPRGSQNVRLTKQFIFVDLHYCKYVQRTRKKVKETIGKY